MPVGVTLSNVQIQRVTRRISSGDNGASTNPPLTSDEIKAGGRLEDFWLATASGSDGHGYQWTFALGTTIPQAKTSVIAWFAAGKPSTGLVAPMLTATDNPPPTSWSV